MGSHYIAEDILWVNSAKTALKSCLIEGGDFAVDSVARSQRSRVQMKNGSKIHLTPLKRSARTKKTFKKTESPLLSKIDEKSWEIACKKRDRDVEKLCDTIGENYGPT